LHKGEQNVKFQEETCTEFSSCQHCSDWQVPESCLCVWYFFYLISSKLTPLFPYLFFLNFSLLLFNQIFGNWGADNKGCFQYCNISTWGHKCGREVLATISEKSSASSLSTTTSSWNPTATRTAL
jgi:hypothetical protein